MIPYGWAAADVQISYPATQPRGAGNGAFDADECLAEYLTTKSARGAFAVIMNARQGFAGTSQRFHRLFWNGVFNQGLDDPPRYCTYGAVNQWSKEAAWSGWSDGGHRWPGWGVSPEHPEEDSYMRYCFYELNLFGDPSLPVLPPQSP